LIESQQKKATFLKELIHALGLKNVKVFSDRAENYPDTADLVMLRAVEKFGQALRVAVRLAKPGGRVGLMIGSGQIDSATRVAKDVNWSIGVSIPCSSSRTLLVGTRPLKVE
jgi:16S rRNA G527 N7-methylase RsmG